MALQTSLPSRKRKLKTQHCLCPPSCPARAPSVSPGLWNVYGAGFSGRDAKQNICSPLGFANLSLL